MASGTPKAWPQRGYAPHGCPRVLVFENLGIRGEYTPVLVQALDFSLIDCISVVVDRMQRKCEPVRKAGEGLAEKEMSKSDVWLLVTSSIIGWHVPLVAFFAVLRKIQSLNLMFLPDPQSDGHIHDLERD